jgi:hypothetical protein
MIPSEPGNLQVAARKRKLLTCDRSHRWTRRVDPRTLPIACTKNGSHSLRADRAGQILRGARRKPQPRGSGSAHNRSLTDLKAAALALRARRRNHLQCHRQAKSA